MQSELIPDWLKVFYAEWGPGIRIVLAIVLALVARAVLQFMIHRIVKSVSRSVRKEGDDSPLAQARLLQRTKTIASVLGNLATWGLTFTVLSIALTEIGVSPGAIIAGAGILGAGLGFGAQSLIKDLISGLFIVFEDQYGVGDSVDLGQASGVVESVGLRVTQVRDLEGTVWFVRNGEILRVGNQSQGWSRVVLDVPLDYSSKTEKAQEIMAKVASETAKKFPKLVIGDPEVWGINLLSGDQVVIRLVQKTKPETKDELARVLRANLKQAFEKNRIKLAKGANSIYLNVINK
ncbi:MAG: mechanosensitive ion channel family protein [Microbacteriaceae bacterium]|nr:mechanosensitive ion channel family protein [Microbacteriaceae bacterium]